jgi:hypothetical protein
MILVKYHSFIFKNILSEYLLRFVKIDKNEM